MTARPPLPGTPSSRLTLDAVVHDEAWPLDITDTAFLARIAATLEHHLDVATPECAVIAFSDDARVRALNMQYLGKDQPTNVLSFPAFKLEIDHTSIAAEMDVPATFLGDIILARETIFREAVEQDRTIGHHVAHLIIHGMLHIFGYDHDSADAAEAMEMLEIDILASLGIANPYTEELVDVG